MAYKEQAVIAAIAGLAYHYGYIGGAVLGLVALLFLMQTRQER